MSEISKSTLAELFSRNPLDLTSSDIATMVKGLREQRKVWSQAEATAKATGKKTSVGDMISLDDLTLDV